MRAAELRRTVVKGEEGMTSAKIDSNIPYEEARTWHLATNSDDELATSFEFALMQVYEAYQRWVVQGQRLVSYSEINYNETVVLHVVRMQERAKDAATIAKLVNRDDLPNVLYNLRKLVSIGLIQKVRIGAGTYFEITEQGRIETDRYAELRRDLLVRSMKEIAQLSEKLKTATDLMHSLTGCYDTASRETAVMNPAMLFPERGKPEPTKTSRTPSRASRKRS
jgi:predicted MarR family transcription regulator